MRILHVGNGNQVHRGARYFDQTRKITHGFIRNGHDVYFISDRDVSRANNLIRSRKLGKRPTNEYFLDCCYNYKPELVVLGHADIIRPDTVAQARKILPKARFIQWNVDAIFNPHTVAQINSKAPLMDATFVTTAGSALSRFHHEGHIACYMPNIVDASVEWPRCHERTDQQNDIFWALRATEGSYAGDPRIEIPLFLDQNPEIRVDYHGMQGRPVIFTAEYFEHIANCKMGINISSARARGQTVNAPPEELYLYSSDRVAHYMGSGLLVFTTQDNRLQDLYLEDKELLFFTAKEELAEKVLYYKRHETKRQEIAKAGWEKAHRCFNDRMVTQYMIETVFGLPHTQHYAWPLDKY